MKTLENIFQKIVLIIMCSLLAVLIMGNSVQAKDKLSIDDFKIGSTYTEDRIKFCREI